MSPRAGNSPERTVLLASALSPVLIVRPDESTTSPVSFFVTLRPVMFLLAPGIPAPVRTSEIFNGFSVALFTDTLMLYDHVILLFSGSLTTAVAFFSTLSPELSFWVYSVLPSVVSSPLALPPFVLTFTVFLSLTFTVPVPASARSRVTLYVTVYFCFAPMAGSVALNPVSLLS